MYRRKPAAGFRLSLPDLHRFVPEPGIVRPEGGLFSQ